jgi:hypothetical protein
MVLTVGHLAHYRPLRGLCFSPVVVLGFRFAPPRLYAATRFAGWNAYGTQNLYAFTGV